jgi:hypothetical protein
MNLPAVTVFVAALLPVVACRQPDVTVETSFSFLFSDRFKIRSVTTEIEYDGFIRRDNVTPNSFLLQVS